MIYSFGKHSFVRLYFCCIYVANFMSLHLKLYIMQCIKWKVSKACLRKQIKKIEEKRSFCLIYVESY